MTTPNTTSITYRFLREVRPTKSDTTLSHYQRRLRLMARSVPDEISAVSERHLLRWLATTTTPATFNAYLSTARVFFRWACRAGYCGCDPSCSIDRARLAVPLPRAFTFGEVGDIMAVAQAHSTALARAVTLMCQEGLRVGEAAAADWADLEVARRRLGVRGKGHRGLVSRTVPLSAQSALILGAGLRRGPIVPTATGSHYKAQSLGDLVTTLIREAVGGVAGDGRTAHALRHSAATHMIDQGGGVRDVQRILGHRSVATTERYISGATDDTQRTVDGRWYGPEAA